MRPLSIVFLAWSVLAGCSPKGDPKIGPEGLTETFDGSALAPMWRNTGGPYRLEDGKLLVAGARNKPLWLRRKLPRNVRIALDVKSDSQAGDIKVEVFGDGESHATESSYTATSYVVIFGGWNNSKNIIARMDEHAPDRAVGPPRKVEPGRTYRLVIERKGNVIRATVDGEELATMTDPEPLEGPGHEYFAINNWESELTFDNLEIRPL